MRRANALKLADPTFGFQIRYTIRDLAVTEPHNFDYGGPHAVKVVVRAPSDDEMKIGHKQSNAFCIASAAWPVSEKNRKIFERLVRKRRILPLSEFPQHFRSFVQGVNRELHDFANRTSATLRWRCNVDFGPHNPLSGAFLQWSTDPTAWHTAPIDTHVHGEVRYPLRASARMLSDVLGIVKNGGSEPLHHNLFREAWEQRLTNPRSALVIGIGAVEVAVKRCIGTLVPDAEWLAINAPAPRIGRILREYLPKLAPRCAIEGKVKPPPKSILKPLEDGVLARNRVIHAGARTPPFEELEEILVAVRELLWLLDFYTGFEWAFDFLSTRTKSELRIQRKT